MAMNARLLLTLLISGVSLTACDASHTQWMANGYRYQDDTPLSSPAPSRPWHNELTGTNLNHIGENTVAWQGATYEVVGQLSQLVSPSLGPITLIAQKPITPSTSAFDHYLRQTLQATGYTINPASGGKVVVGYSVQSLETSSAQKAAQKSNAQLVAGIKDFKDTYLLSVQVLGEKNKVMAERSTLAVLPYEAKRK